MRPSGEFSHRFLLAQGRQKVVLHWRQRHLCILFAAGLLHCGLRGFLKAWTTQSPKSADAAGGNRSQMLLRVLLLLQSILLAALAVVPHQFDTNVEATLLGNRWDSAT